MSDITFTPEQVKEIRRRIEESQQAQLGACDEGAFFGRVRAEGIRAVCINLLSRFPLPKVTRFRTFTMTWGDLPESKVETYRVNGQVEYLSADGRWYQTNYGTGSIRSFAEELAAKCRWKALATLADVAARPTEEVDA